MRMRTALRDRKAIHRTVSSLVPRSSAVKVTVIGELPHLTIRIRVDARDTALLIRFSGRGTAAVERVFTALRKRNGFAYRFDVAGIPAD